MIQRCEDKALRWYHRYGGRGISVCPEWRHSYATFLRDMGRRPSRDHSLDRIDPDKGYSAANCRWATETEQQRNRANSVYVEWRGEMVHVNELSERTGVNVRTIKARMKRGVSGDDLVAPAWKCPVGRQFDVDVTYRGEVVKVTALCKALGIPRNSFMRRLSRHGTAEDAVSAWMANRKGKKGLKT